MAYELDHWRWLRGFILGIVADSIKAWKQDRTEDALLCCLNAGFGLQVLVSIRSLGSRMIEGSS